MSCLIKIMRVKDKDEKGCVFEYNNRVYFVDKKDTSGSRYNIGDYVPTVIIKELSTYGFIVTASSLSELYIDILKQSKLDLNNLYKVVLNKEGYISNINNVIQTNNVDVTSINITSQSLDLLLDLVYSNMDKINKDINNTYNKFVRIIKLLYIVDTQYSELVKYKNS